MNELNQMTDSNGDVFVDDFVVGRRGYGRVKFYGRTNVAGLNLDEIGKDLKKGFCENRKDFHVHFVTSNL